MRAKPVPGLPHVMLIELRKVLIPYQDYHMVLLEARSVSDPASLARARGIPSQGAKSSLFICTQLRMCRAFRGIISLFADITRAGSCRRPRDAR